MLRWRVRHAVPDKIPRVSETLRDQHKRELHVHVRRCRHAGARREQPHVAGQRHADSVQFQFYVAGKSRRLVHTCTLILVYARVSSLWTCVDVPTTNTRDDDEYTTRKRFCFLIRRRRRRRRRCLATGNLYRIDKINGCTRCVRII